MLTNVTIDCVAVKSISESVALMSLIFLTNASEVQFKYDTRKNYRYYNNYLFSNYSEG